MVEAEVVVVPRKKLEKKWGTNSIGNWIVEKTKFGKKGAGEGGVRVLQAKRVKIQKWRELESS
jgi:hypothetical protein